MGKRQILIGSKPFSSRAAAARYAKEVLAKYAALTHEQPITDPDDVEFITAYLWNYHKAAEKFGVGLDYFYVKQNGSHPCFWIKRKDGSFSDFSVDKCMQSADAIHRGSVKSAFRHAINGQTEWYKNEKFRSESVIPCELCGLPLPREDSHVDHEVHHETLLVDFVAMKEIELYDVEIVSGGNGVPPKIKDLVLRREWQDYHKKHAVLRVIHSRENLTREKAS